MSVLVAIEGIDGSGKGTQTQMLCEKLQERGLRTGRLQFPRYSETVFGGAIADFLNGKFGSLDQVHPQLAAVLYACDRFESLSELQALREANDVVVLDRFVGSNLAHQAAKLDGDERRILTDWILKVEHEVFGLPKPSLTILIDMPSEWSRELVGRKEPRTYTDRTADLQESDLPYLERVRRCYQDLAAANESDWSVVAGVGADGSLASIEAVHQKIMQLVLPQIPTQPHP